MMNQPLDAKFEEVDHPARPKWRWMLMGLALGIMPGIAAILLFIFLRQTPDLPDYEPKIRELQQEIATLKTEIGRLPPPADLAPLREEIANIKQSQPDITSILSRLAQMENGIAEKDRALDDRITQLQSTIEARPLDKHLILGMALLHWRYALEAGLSFRPTLYEIARLNENNDERVMRLMDMASPFAETGAPTLRQLQETFPAKEIAAKLMDQEKSNEGTGWISAIQRELSKIISIRRAEPSVAQNDFDKLAKAEQAIHQGNIQAAMDDMTTLPEPAKNWTEKAHHRILADKIQSEMDILLSDLVGR